MNLLEPFQPTDGAIHELDSERTHGLLMVEDDGVVAALAHVDVSGTVYPFQSVFRPVARTHQGHATRDDLIQNALIAWKELSPHAPNPFNRMILCTPAASARSRQASSRIRVEVTPGSGSLLPKVDDDHLRKLDDRLCMQNTSESFVVVDMAIHSYADDSGHERPIPTGTVTSSLEARAHLVMSPTDLVVGLIDAFRPLGIRFDVLMSAFAAAEGHLTPNEEDGTVLVDVDRGACWCSWFGWGRLLHTAVLPGGSDAIRAGCADRLALDPVRFTSWLSSHADLFRHGTPAVSLASAPPDDRLTSATLQTLYDAAAAACAGLGRELRQSTRSATGCLTPVRKVIVMGDDPFAVQALVAAAASSGAFKVVSRFVSEAHGLEHIRSPRIGRMVGAFRLGGRGNLPRQHFIEVCYPPYAERLRKRMASVAPIGSAGRRLLRSPAMARSFSGIIQGLQSLLF